MNNAEKAVSIFNDGFSCSQAVLTAFANELGIDEETALKISYPFGGGIARTAETCGAVTGALMAIGLKFASKNSNDADEKNYLNGITKKFLDDFIAVNKTVKCKELLYCDISTEEGRKTFSESNLRTTHCTKYVNDCANLIGTLFSKVD